MFLFLLRRCSLVSLLHSLLSLSAQSVSQLTLLLVPAVTRRRPLTVSAPQITVTPALITSLPGTLPVRSCLRCLSSVQDAAVIAGPRRLLTRRVRIRSSRTPGATLISDFNPPLREVYFSVNFICLQMIIFTPAAPSRKAADWRSSAHTLTVTRETALKKQMPTKAR